MSGLHYRAFRTNGANEFLRIIDRHFVFEFESFHGQRATLIVKKAFRPLIGPAPHGPLSPECTPGQWGSTR